MAGTLTNASIEPLVDRWDRDLLDGISLEALAISLTDDSIQPRVERRDIDLPDVISL